MQGNVDTTLARSGTAQSSLPRLSARSWDDTHSTPSSVNQAIAIAPNQKKLQEFREETEQALATFLNALRAQYQQYANDPRLLQTELQDVNGLERMNTNLTQFLFPSTLAPVKHWKDKIGVEVEAPPPPSSSKVVPIDTIASDVVNRKDLERTLKEALSTAMLPLREVVKDSVFSVLIPMRELESNTSDQFACLQKTIQALSAEVSMMKMQQHRRLSEDSFVRGRTDVTVDGSPRTPTATGAADPSMDTSAYGLNIGSWHLDFASDLLSGRAHDAMSFLSSMHARETPLRATMGYLTTRFGPEPERRSILAKALWSEHSERLVSFIILLNVVSITYATNYGARNPHSQTDGIIVASEVFFQIFYMLELALKLWVQRLYFFVASDWRWNWLDFLLVATGMFDLFVALTGLSWDGSYEPNNFNLTFLRVLRLARFSRVIRVFRVLRFVSELHVLLKVIQQSLKPLFWCTIMLIVFFFIFAIIFVNAAISYMADPHSDKSNEADIKEHWGTVSRAMISLYKATTGGKDWGSVSDTLDDCGRLYYCIFLFFIAFIILALLNILTGIFVDRAMKATAEDKDGEAISKLEADREAVRDFCKLHCVISGKPVEEKATITVEQFEKHLKSAAMRARFAVLGLDVWDSRSFFGLLVKLGDSDEVNLHTFVGGCMQMRGSAHTLGIQGLSRQLSAVIRLLGQKRERTFLPQGPSGLVLETGI